MTPLLASPSCVPGVCMRSHASSSFLVAPLRFSLSPCLDIAPINICRNTIAGEAVKALGRAVRAPLIIPPRDQSRRACTTPATVLAFAHRCVPKRLPTCRRAPGGVQRGSPFAVTPSAHHCRRGSLLPDARDALAVRQDCGIAARFCHCPTPTRQRYALHSVPGNARCHSTTASRRHARGRAPRGDVAPAELYHL